MLQDMELKHGCATEMIVSPENSGNLLELNSQSLLS